MRHNNFTYYDMPTAHAKFDNTAHAKFDNTTVDAIKLILLIYNNFSIV